MVPVFHKKKLSSNYVRVYPNVFCERPKGSRRWNDLSCLLALAAQTTGDNCVHIVTDERYRDR